MATGIVSIATFRFQLPALPQALFVFNSIAYVVLVVLNGLRLLWFPRRMIEDLVDHRKGPGFFTWVAATCVLGSQYIRIGGNFPVAVGLWAAGIVLWVVLTYTIFTAFTVKENKPSLDEGITGAWLLTVVATQAIAVLGALLAPYMAEPHRTVTNFIAVSYWLAGGMLYIWMISLIFYRYTFFKFSPGDLAPPYWINMGAMAISTLAGSLLIRNAPELPILASLAPFMKGFTVFFWVTGTWWIPMLLVLGIWRHVIRRFPLVYDPQYWGAVFPLGMYTVATYEMDTVLGLGFLMGIPRVFLWAAVAAWTVVFGGMVGQWARPRKAA